jgi:hypothetical protein
MICIDSLRVFSESRAILQFFGARRLSQQSYSSFPEPPKGTYPYIRRYASSGLVLARSAECGHRSRLRAFCNPCAAQSCPSWSESQRLSWSTRRSWGIRLRPLNRLLGRAQGQPKTLWAWHPRNTHLQQFAEKLISRRTTPFLHPSWHPNPRHMKFPKALDQLF